MDPTPTMTINWADLLKVAAPIVSALVTQVVKMLAPKIPKAALWLVSLVLGSTTAALGFSADPAGFTTPDIGLALGLGLAGTGVAEGGKQVADLATQNPDRLRTP